MDPSAGGLQAHSDAFFSGPVRPGCYDEPAFARLELANPKVLEDYARFVLRRPLTDAYEERARAAVEIVTEEVVRACPPEAKFGSCNLITNVTVRLLEGLDVWAFGVRGSVRFEYPNHPQIEPDYFWLQDRRHFPGAFTGHAWVVAPPFAVVDGTASDQKWMQGQGNLIPQRVLALRDEVDILPPQRDVLASAELRPLPGMPLHPDLVTLWKELPPVRVRAPDVTVTYQPGGVALPLEPLNDPRWTLALDGMRPNDFFTRVILPRWRARFPSA